MNNSQKRIISKKFNISFHGLKIEFEFFTFEYIEEKLKEIEKTNIINNVKFLEIEEKNPFRGIKELYEENDSRYYFSYIKFFEFDKKLYGIVGGKTNYKYPDINFSLEGNAIAKTFLRDNNLKYSRKVAIMDHYSCNLGRKKDNYQAIFIERFLQRTFNLFDS